MHITLKQSEIELALKGYITTQGIRLGDKDIGITFTAGRKETGISAEITIEDSDLPIFTGHADGTHAPVVLTMVHAPHTLALTVSEGQVDSVEAAVSDVQSTETEEAEAPEPAAQVKTTSLFN